MCDYSDSKFDYLFDEVLLLEVDEAARELGLDPDNLFPREEVRQYRSPQRTEAQKQRARELAALRRQA
jgi:hypothetical protein